jgi:branched-chain amino acid transport system ATP-binding protein
MLLQVSGLSTTYGPVRAVDGVSLEVPKGGLIGVIGRNGAGKSSLLRTICGLERAAGGTVTLEGKRVDGQPAHQVLRAGIAYVPEGRRVFAEMSVLDNLRVGAFAALAASQQAPYERLLQRVFGIFPVLSERARQRAGTLSGGQQQMLAIGRALMSEPRLLMLDEPSMGLAPVVFHGLFDTIERLNREGLSILMVEQKAYLTLRRIHYGYVLANGKLVQRGTGQALLADPEIQAAYLGRAGGQAPPAAIAPPKPQEQEAAMPERPDHQGEVAADLAERRRRLLGGAADRLRRHAAPPPPAAAPGAAPPRPPIRVGLTREQALAQRHRHQA